MTRPFTFFNSGAHGVTRPTTLLAVLLLILNVWNFSARAEDAPAAAGVSGGAAPLNSPSEMEAGALEGLYSRLGMQSDDFEGTTAAKGTEEAPKDGTPNGDKGEGKSNEIPEDEGDRAIAEAKKKEEEEAARLEKEKKEGKGGDEPKPVDLTNAGLSEAQATAVAGALEAAQKDGGELDLVKLGLNDEQQAKVIAALGAAGLVEAEKKPDEATDDAKILAALGLNENQTAAVKKILEDKGDVKKLTADLQTITQERDTLKTELANKQPGVAVVPLHPAAFITDPAKLAAREQQLANFEGWAIDNWEGSEEIPASADGKTPAVRAYTKEEVRARYKQIKHEREIILPKVKESLAWQQTFEQQQVAPAYPQLLKAGTPEKQLLDSILSKAPGLAAVFPNIKMIIGDAMVGEQIRVAAAQKKNGAGKGKVKLAPRLPMGASGGRAAITVRKKASAEIDVEEFDKRGGTRDALAQMIAGSGLVGGRN